MRTTALALALAVAPIATADLVDPAFLEQYAATYRFRLGTPANIQGSSDGAGVYFLRSGPRSFVRDLYYLDLETGKERVVLTAADLLGGAREELTPEEKARRERQRLVAKGIASFSLSRDGSRLLIPLSGKLWVVDAATGRARQLPDEGGPALDARFSPDGLRVACVRDHDLWVIDVEAGTQRRVTTRAGEHESYGESEFVAQEEMGRYRGYWWSPDSHRLLVQHTDTTKVETWRIADPLDPSKAPDPWPYPRPGRSNARVRLAIYPAGEGAPVPVTWDHEAYEYLAHVTWPDQGPLTLVVQDRRQRSSVVLAGDPTTGKTRELLRDEDPAWVNLHGENPTWLPGGERFLWVSEADGWKRLELRDSTGRLERVLAGRAQGFDGLGRVLPGGEVALATVRPDQTQRHLVQISLTDPTAAPVAIAAEEGVHFASHREHSPLTAVRSYLRSGGKAMRILRGTTPLEATPRDVAEAPPFQARCEWLEVGEDPTLPAVLVRPRDFQAGKQYPVLLDVYGGPGVTTVSASPRWYTLAQWIADQGFVVVSLDGRGTPGRGRDWERSTYKDLIAKPLEDQTRAIQELCRRFPELDGERIGVFGWSFGGYFSAMAVLREPGVFKAGVAGAPVVDWADYDTHYTERYMGLPAENAEGYAAANVLTYAPQLSRPLLLVHGTGDDNVYFMHSLKLANALFRAGKDFDFLPLAGFTHMVPDPVVLQSLWGRIVGHFQKHLGGPE